MLFVSALTGILQDDFDLDFDLRKQFFNMLMLIGSVSGVVVALIAIAIKEPLEIVLLDLLIAVLAFALLRIANSKNCYHLCSWIVIVAVFLVAFPLMFLFCGGYRSGIPCFFLLSIVFTAHLLDKTERVIALLLEFATYLLCFYCAYYRPQMIVSSLPERIYIINVAVNFIVSGGLLVATVILRNRLIHQRQIQIQELNRELETRNDSLARYDVMKSNFLGSIAHEINTPLAVIAASSHDTLDLLESTPLNLDEIIENQVIITKRVKLIDNIILDLMDTVAIENGRLSLSRQYIQLGELLAGICDSQFKRIDTGGNRIEYELEPNLPSIWVDPQRIEQVMTNLLSNAARHTQGGTITVALKGAANAQVVAVTDNGEGMDTEMVRIALKQYVSTKADHWRHGIGLFVCRQIITSHGGEIWIHSEKGRGTSVFFSLREGPEYE